MALSSKDELRIGNISNFSNVSNIRSKDELRIGKGYKKWIKKLDWNVLECPNRAPCKRLYQAIGNPKKMLASVKLMNSYRRK